jgi:hypothetical protein
VKLIFINPWDAEMPFLDVREAIALVHEIRDQKTSADAF